MGRELRCVIRLEHIAAGRAGHERVVKRADHVQHKRPAEAHLDFQHRQQFAPAIRANQIDQRKNKQRRQEQARARVLKHRPDAAIDQRIRQARRRLADDLIGLDDLDLAGVNVPIPLPQIPRPNRQQRPMRLIRIARHLFGNAIVFDSVPASLNENVRESTAARSWLRGLCALNHRHRRSEIPSHPRSYPRPISPRSANRPARRSARGCTRTCCQERK